jgi:7-cyano-7-deazaguanine synthase in queuosine biosynthesis
MSCLTLVRKEIPSGKRHTLINKARLNFSSETTPNIVSLNRNVIMCGIKGRYAEKAFFVTCFV